MGNRLSQILADICTNYATKKALQCFDPQDVSFVVKYVDDFVGAMREDLIQKFEIELVSTIEGLNIKRTDESVENCVTFLDTMVIRNGSNISTKWWQKSCSSHQILNFHSYHPIHMKINVIREYVRHAVSITSHDLMHSTVKKIRLVMRKSSYPKSVTEPVLKCIK